MSKVVVEIIIVLVIACVGGFFAASEMALPAHLRPSHTAPAAELNQLPTVLAAELPWTLLLMGSSMLLTLVIGIPLGVTAARRQGGLVDRGIQVISVASGSLFVPIAQPHARLAMHLLEPLAPDSFVTWGFFDVAFDATKMGWLVGVHLVFVVSALILALSDRWGSDHGDE